MLPTIQSLWIGTSLSNMEKLCIQSFIDHGHEFHLYTYADVGGIPDGAVVKDGNEILPASEIFRYNNGSYAGFSNWFRYQLVNDKGGAWADMDMVCLQPLVFGDELVLASEPGITATTSLIIAPQAHPLMVAMAQACRDMKKKEGSKFHAVGGPSVLAKMVQKMGYTNAVKPFHYFVPLSSQQWMLPFTENCGGGTGAFGPECYTLHLFNEMLRRSGLPKNATFDSLCLIEVLKKQHNISAVAGSEQVTSVDIQTLISRCAAELKDHRKRRIKRERILYLIVSALIGVALGWFF